MEHNTIYHALKSLISLEEIKQGMFNYIDRDGNVQVYTLLENDDEESVNKFFKGLDVKVESCNRIYLRLELENGNTIKWASKKKIPKII